MSLALEHLPPMLYAGRVNCVTGYGEAARHQIHVLRRHGLRLQIVDTGSVGDPDPDRESGFVQAARKSDPGPGALSGSIIHLSPNMAQIARLGLPHPHILVSVWETTRLPAEWVPMVNSFDQVWCATAWQYGVYRDSGVDPAKLRVVPFAIDPTLYPVEGARLHEVYPAEFIFGSVFQWTARKAPEALVGAFLHAFQAGEPVLLLLKAYEGDDADTSVASKVEQIVRSYRLTGPVPKIQVISRRLSREQMLAFYRSIHCYVSTHRGEGFGLPIAEALLMDKPTLATGWSAPADYAAGCFSPIPFQLEPPREMIWQPYYTVDQLWASPNIAIAAELMRTQFDTTSRGPRERTVTRFDSIMGVVGVAARAALEDLLR